LRAHDVPVGLINRAPDLATDPHITAREMIVRLAAGFGADIPMTGVVPKLSRTPGAIRSVGPALGQHTDEVLRDLAGCTAAEIAALRDGGVVE
jgi:formyl-CoA transferase